MSDIPTLVQLAPNIIVALVIVGAVGWLIKIVNDIKKNNSMPPPPPSAHQPILRAEVGFNPEDTGQFQRLNAATEVFLAPLAQKMDDINAQLAKLEKNTEEESKARVDRDTSIGKSISRLAERMASVERDMDWIKKTYTPPKGYRHPTPRPIRKVDKDD